METELQKVTADRDNLRKIVSAIAKGAADEASSLREQARNCEVRSDVLQTMAESLRRALNEK